MKEEDFLAKYDAGEEFTEEEISKSLFEFPEVHEEQGECHRWTQAMTTYINVSGRLFRIDWMRGLTEDQEDEYLDQPVEVRQKTYQKMVTVTEYIPVK